LLRELETRQAGAQTVRAVIAGAILQVRKSGNHVDVESPSGRLSVALVLLLLGTREES
jgi:hypothetical protein